MLRGGLSRRPFEVVVVRIVHGVVAIPLGRKGLDERRLGVCLGVFQGLCRISAIFRARAGSVANLLFRETPCDPDGSNAR